MTRTTFFKSSAMAGLATLLGFRARRLNPEWVKAEFEELIHENSGIRMVVRSEFLESNSLKDSKRTGKKLKKLEEGRDRFWPPTYLEIPKYL